MKKPQNKTQIALTKRFTGIKKSFRRQPMGRRAGMLGAFVVTAAVAGVAIHHGLWKSSAATDTQYGLSAMSSLEQLPQLKQNMQAGGQSSFERNTVDASNPSNDDLNSFLFTSGSEKVMLDQKGPGTIYRIWTTGFNPATDWIKMYFDGETTPRVNMKMADLFSGTKAPFLAPLVADNNKSSGGFVSYLPLPYSKSLRITTNMSNYYNVGYHSYTADTSISTWTGKEDSSSARTLWNNVGQDPNNETDATTAAATANVPAGGSQTILDTDGPRQITSLKVKLPGTVAPANITDEGRAHKGSSQFTMAVSPSNTGVTLKRRLDYSIANQKATVYINGVNAGTWYDAGTVIGQWRDSSFTIPASMTKGKSSITIKVQFVSSAIDWNEFTYWTYSTVGGTPILSDTLNVGNASNESAHRYTIAGQSWSGTRTFQYSGAATADILNSTRIRMYWDGETTPAVDAPLGSFFAMGQFGAYNTRALPVGMSSDGTMYMYFPMPFASHAIVQLVNTSTQDINGASYAVMHKPYAGDFASTAYFRTKFTATTPTTLGRDIQILDTTGSGKLVGTVHSYSGEMSRWYLEGDERIYVDDSSSPAIHGTGTEDYFNGGWYFDRGSFSQPLSGNTTHTLTATDNTAAYRLFLQDAIPFNKHLKVSIEHGGRNENTMSAWTLAYYYQKPANRMALTDTVNVGNLASESAHQYAITGQSWTGSRTFTYEGDDDTVAITDDGRAHKGSSQFNIAVDANNQGVTLRRRFDQSVANQQATVYVDGKLAGTWYRAGSDTFHQWRDDDFQIPASLTAGKSTVTVKVQFASSAIDWNEFTYWAYSLLP